MMTPVVRTVYIYSPVTFGQYQANQYSSPIASTVSGSDGAYSITVPAGSYSVIVDDGGVKYCNLFSAGFACPVTVGQTSVPYDITIDVSAQ